MTEQMVDGIAFRMAKEYDFGFLRRFGQVFRIFDDQDSGNISFGMDDGQTKRFIKFAGAQTARYEGTPKEAVKRLKAAEKIYQDLAHPALIRLQAAGAMGGGYALVFDWVEGDCMGHQYPQGHARFMALSREDKLRAYGEVLSFQQNASRLEYMAVDFYDGSLLYDAVRKKTWICDVDLYRQGEFVNEMGRMWGSSRFMAPEEFEKGARITERTNVYRMAAMAWHMFGQEEWQLSETCREMVCRAMEARQPDTVGEFVYEWNERNREVIV